MSRARISAALLALSLLAGCKASPAPGKSGAESRPQNDPSSPVYTDWSKLTPYAPAERAEPLYTRFEPFQGDTLTPRDDYGVLIPYLGAKLNVSNYITDKLPLFGLLTTDGRVVTEPVYADVYSFSSQGTPFLVLQKGDPDGKPSNGMFSQSGEFLCAVAAMDGSWMREFGVAGTLYMDGGRLAVVQADNSVTVLDAAGETAAYFPGALFAPYIAGQEFPYFTYDGSPRLSSKDGVLFVEGCDEAFGNWRSLCYLNIAGGALSPDPPEGFDPKWPEGGESGDFPEGYMDVRDAVTGERYSYRQDYDGRLLELLSADKQPLLSVKNESSSLWQPLIWNGLCSAVEGGAFRYYDLKSGDCVFRFPLRSNHG